MDKPLTILIIIAGIFLVVIGAFASAGVNIGDYIRVNYQNSLNQVNNGKQVSCNVPMSAKLTGALSINDPVSCTTGNSCMQPLSIIGSITGTDVQGSLILTQSGKQYGSVGVTQNILLGSSNYMVSGCVPKAATQVRLSAINKNGGVDDEHLISIS